MTDLKANRQGVLYTSCTRSYVALAPAISLERGGSELVAVRVHPPVRGADPVPDERERRRGREPHADAGAGGELLRGRVPLLRRPRRHHRPNGSAVILGRGL